MPMLRARLMANIIALMLLISKVTFKTRGLLYKNRSSPKTYSLLANRSSLKTDLPIEQEI